MTIDEVAPPATGVSYLQELDMRMNEEHPPREGARRDPAVIEAHGERLGSQDLVCVPSLFVLDPFPDPLPVLSLILPCSLSQHFWRICGKSANFLDPAVSADESSLFFSLLINLGQSAVS